MQNSSNLVYWKRKGQYLVGGLDDPNALENIHQMLCVQAKQTALKKTVASVVFEDATNYLTGNIKLNIIEIITSCRHSNCDVYFISITLAMYRPKCIEMQIF